MPVPDYSLLRLSALLLVLMPGVPARSAEASHDFLQSRLRHAEALSSYLDAQLAQQQHVSIGLNSLRKLGHASQQECDLANLKLNQLHGRIAATAEFTTFLQEVRVAEHNAGSSEESTDTSPAVFVARPSVWSGAASGRMLVLAGPFANTNSKRRPRKSIARLGQHLRDAQVAAIEARTTFCQRQLQQLRNLPEPWPGELAEIRRLELAMSVLRKEAVLVETSPSVIEPVHGVHEFSFRGRAVKSVDDLTQLVQDQWAKCRMNAEADAVVAETAFLQRQHDRLQMIAATDAVRPNELLMTTAQLRQSTARQSHLLAGLAQNQAASDTVAPASQERHLAEFRRQSSAARLEKVSELADHDVFFTSERNWLEQMTRIHALEVAIVLERQELSQAIGDLFPESAESSVVQTSTEAPSSSTLTRFQTVLRMSISKSAMQRATVVLNSAQQRMEALEQLRSEGHASPIEILQAQMLVDVSRAELKVARLKNKLSRAGIQFVDELQQQQRGREVTLR